MTTNVKLEQALLHLDDTLLQEFFATQAVAPPKKTHHRTRRVWRTAIAVCCCLCLLVTGITVMGRLDYHPFLASCGSYPGTIVAGDYYYFVPHRGVYCYDPDTNASHLVLHTFWTDEYVVGATGVFYEHGRSVYLCDFESGQRRHLYTANALDTTHIALDRMTTGDIAVTCYNKHDMTLYQVILHGMRGEVQHVTEVQSSSAVKYSEAHHAVVGRPDITLVQTDELDRIYMDVQEGGVSLLPDGATVSKYSAMQIGLSLWFTVSYGGRPSYETSDYLVLDALLLDAGGDTRILTLPYEPYSGGDGEYLFYPTYDRSVGCVEIATGESWVLTTEEDTSDVYDVVCDGTYLYTTAPWCEQQSAWRIERDEAGKPVSMTLINPNLAGK